MTYLANLVKKTLKTKLLKLLNLLNLPVEQNGSVDISKLPTVQLSSSDVVANVLNHPDLDDCMLVYE